MTETRLQPSETAQPPAMGRGASFIPAIWDRATGIAGRRGFIVLFLVIGVLLPLIDHNEGDIDAVRRETPKHGRRTPAVRVP